MKLRTCVTPEGVFRYAEHRPAYLVYNLRQGDHHLVLGKLADETDVHNRANFPEGEVEVSQASTVYEIPNAFSFRGSTFIDAGWADSRSVDPLSLGITATGGVSMSRALESWAGDAGVSVDKAKSIFNHLPAPVLLALATTSSDPGDLVKLAHLACDFSSEPGSVIPQGLAYTRRQDGAVVPVIHDRDLFEAVGNNPSLPDHYKKIMLLQPGVQGVSEIVGDAGDAGQGTQVFEYLRRNSYIPWGHYASNMGHQAVRYRARDLSLADMQGLRHLYYQRTYVRLARELDMHIPARTMTEEDLEDLRNKITAELDIGHRGVFLSACLWGWNFGFDFAPSRYRLHGSHQQVHQQHAMVPVHAKEVLNGRVTGNKTSAFSAGDMVAETVEKYQEETGRDFFQDYISCLRSNVRMDGRDAEHSLIVHEDEHVILFVPKAQVSQWELQLLPQGNVGNILEADTACRAALDRSMLLALQTLEGLGAKMVTSIEYSKRFTDPGAQRLLYSFLPKLPWSPGSFSEAQHRFISGHYPEDFATACRNRIHLTY
ncbi:hypothetical protein [Desulfonatronospira sp.]|uniref:hypothetical protein n=1 Tax=Desulfonatronospira sp. TaxID=1962951 RepID=UPI0025C0437D|nr:hypothetical protein [Desulfonatronospira sp.]